MLGWKFTMLGTKKIFNGGWAVLDILCSLIHSLIHWFIDSLIKKNFRVYLEHAHPAFLTTIVVLVLGIKIKYFRRRRFRTVAPSPRKIAQFRLWTALLSLNFGEFWMLIMLLCYVAVWFFSQYLSLLRHGGSEVIIRLMIV